jgi:voltage-dependent calcium channel alpha-2/delta-4
MLQKYLPQPFKVLFFAFKWMMAELFIELSRLQFWVSAYPSDDIKTLDYGDSEEDILPEPPRTQRPEGTTKKPIKARKGLSIEDEEFLLMKELTKKENKTIYYPCDKKSELYVLQQDTLKGRTFSLDTATNGSR